MSLRATRAVCGAVVAGISTLVLSAAAAHLPAAAATAKPCREMGPSIVINGTTTPVCRALYATGAAIRFPNDGPTTRYGALNTLTEATFVDRSGKQVPVKPALVPKTPNVGVGGLKSYAQIIYRATLNKGKITKVAPALFVPVTVPLQAYKQQAFIGEANNLSAGEGVPATDFVRMDFSTTFNADGALMGRFTNLTKSVRRDQMTEPPAPCMAALLGLDQPRNDWYSAVLGTSGTIRLVWDPAMHAPQDSELVIYVGSGIGYMTHSPTLLELMSSHIKPSAQMQFTIHGNPIGTVAWFSGSFQPKFPVVECTYTSMFG